MASNTPFIGNYSYTDNGVIIPDTADVQETVQEEFKAALGTDLSLEESTPQGRLIDVETTARQNTIRFNAQIVNVLVNIYSASGTVLDAWGANFDKYRKDATVSTVPVTVTGAPGTVIPANSQAIADDGIIWQALNEIIIDETGEAKGVFYCSQTGVISLEAGALRTIVASTTTGIVGWETIVNTSVAEIGSDLESDTSFRERIINGLFSGSALFGNYASVCYDIDGVKDVYTYDNPKGKPLQLDDISIPPHSVYVCVDGGNAEDIAYAIYGVKSAGCGWCGNTTVTVIDKEYNTTNTVIFQIPSETALKIVVNLTSLYNSNANLTEQVQNTILNYANGDYKEQGYEKLGIRSLLSPFTIASMLNSQIQGVNINKVEVGLVTPKPHAVISINKASVTSGIIWASVDTAIFGAKTNQNGTYNFIFNGTDWLVNGEQANLSEYGITITTAEAQNPITGDRLSVIYADGEISEAPINLFASETPQILAENITVNING